MKIADSHVCMVPSASNYERVVNILCEERPGNRCYHSAKNQLNRIEEALAREDKANAALPSGAKRDFPLWFSLINDLQTATRNVNATKTGMELLEDQIVAHGSRDTNRKIVLERALADAKDLHHKRKLALAYATVAEQKLLDQMAKGEQHFLNNYPLPNITNADVLAALMRGKDMRELDVERAINRLERALMQNKTLTDDEVKVLANEYHQAKLSAVFDEGMLAGFQKVVNADTTIHTTTQEEG